MSSTKRISILIADDFKALRDVIRLYLKRADDMNVIDEAPDLNDALESARALHPDVIIMNSDLPPIDYDRPHLSLEGKTPYEVMKSLLK